MATICVQHCHHLRQPLLSNRLQPRRWNAKCSLSHFSHPVQTSFIHPEMWCSRDIHSTFSLFQDHQTIQGNRWNGLSSTYTQFFLKQKSKNSGKSAISLIWCLLTTPFLPPHSVPIITWAQAIFFKKSLVGNFCKGLPKYEPQQQDWYLQRLQNEIVNSFSTLISYIRRSR